MWKRLPNGRTVPVTWLQRPVITNTWGVARTDGPGGDIDNETDGGFERVSPVLRVWELLKRRAGVLIHIGPWRLRFFVFKSIDKLDGATLAGGPRRVDPVIVAKSVMQ